MPLYLFRCPQCGVERETSYHGATPRCGGWPMKRVFSFGVGKVGNAGGSPARSS